MADKMIGSHLLVRTHIADMAIPANRFVKLVTATGSQPHCTLAGAGEAAVGVSRDGYDSGDLVDVVKVGEAWVLAIGNIAVGQPVAAAANGGGRGDHGEHRRRDGPDRRERLGVRSRAPRTGRDFLGRYPRAA